MTDLIRRLSSGLHDVEVCIRPEASAAAFAQRLKDGYVHLRFTGTRGGTELGITVDHGRTDVTSADFDRPGGIVALVGSVTLDSIPVNVHATIDLNTLRGHGRLELVAHPATLDHT